MRLLEASARERSALWAALGTAALAGAALASNCQRTSVGLVPLNDLGTGLYLGQYQGGLYPDGLNIPPAAHHASGLVAAAGVRPLDLNGQASSTGRYVLLSIGMSNTTQEFCSGGGSPPCAPWSFMGQAMASPEVRGAPLVIVNGAKGGQAATSWDEPTDANYDRVRDQVLAPMGLSEAQVQVVWVKQANPGPAQSLPSPMGDAVALERSLGDIARAVRVRYPNCRIMFLSSRIYAGYASTALNPEPYAYEGGFSVKWAISAQITQRSTGVVDPVAGNLALAVAPWLAWGPYLWADGLTPRSDGLVWRCEDVEADGTHPAQSGEQKVASMLLDFMLTSPYAAPWFRADSGCRPDLTTTAMPGSPGYGVPNGVLSNDDFFYYLARFAAGDLAVCDLTTTAVPGSAGYGVPNGLLSNDDFFYYLTLFAAGC